MPDYPPLNETVRFTSSQKSISKLLDFACYSAMVTSNANQWLHFVGTGQYVGPGAQGAIVTLPGFETAELEWAAPPGAPQPPAAPSTEVNVVYFSVWLPPSPGTGSSLQQTPRAYDGETFHRPLVSVQATCVLPAVANRRWMCAAVAGSLQQASGAATQQDCILWDGATGSTVLCVWGLGVTAVVGSADRVALTGLAYFGSVNTVMTLEIAQLVVGVFERVSFGAYLV